MSSTERIPDCLSQTESHPPSLSGRAARLMFGGAIGGGFLGSFVGAFVGVAVGAFSQDISQGLDGAVIGLLVAGLAGAGYGIYLALREHEEPRTQ